MDEEEKKRLEEEKARLEQMRAELDKTIKERVDAEIAEIKGKLDKAYAARDTAIKERDELTRKAREDEIKRLEEEGKHKEALELQLTEARVKLENAERRNTELSRDLKLRSALSTLPFRNERASELAYKEIVPQLIQKEDGVWVHKSGASIADFVDQFAKDEDQSFLFKPVTNSGAGTSGSKSGTGDSKPKSLFGMSQDDVIKLAKEGKLRKK